MPWIFAKRKPSSASESISPQPRPLILSEKMFAPREAEVIWEGRVKHKGCSDYDYSIPGYEEFITYFRTPRGTIVRYVTTVWDVLGKSPMEDGAPLSPIEAVKALAKDAEFDVIKAADLLGVSCEAL